MKCDVLNYIQTQMFVLNISQNCSKTIGAFNFLSCEKNIAA